MSEKHCPIKKTSIGGQALIEGIMMRGPKTTAMAVRDPKNEIILEKWDTPSTNKSWTRRAPIIRGVFNFADSMIFGYKCLMRSAEIAGLEEESEENGGEVKPWVMNLIMILAVVLGIALAVGLFVALPSFLYTLLSQYAHILPEDSRLLRSAFEGIFKVVLLVGYLAAVSLMKDIRRTFMYHGAEHKTIFCYEQGLELTVENIKKQKRFHPRCGTSFLILMILVSILVSMFIPTGIPTVWRVVIKIALIPIIMGIGYELIKFAGRHDNIITRIISAPGVWLQHVTVLEPDESMIECAIAAMTEAIPNDESDNW